MEPFKRYSTNKQTYTETDVDENSTAASLRFARAAVIIKDEK